MSTERARANARALPPSFCSVRHTLCVCGVRCAVCGVRDRPPGWIVWALKVRRDGGSRLPPFTVLSCDNLEGNGKVTRTVVTELATAMFGGWVTLPGNLAGSPGR